MAPIITPPKKKKGLYRKRHIQQKKLLSLFVVHSNGFLFPLESRLTKKKSLSGATNSAGFDLRALNSDVKRTFIVSCKLVKQTIH